MSVPVVGSVLLAVLSLGSFGEARSHFRQGFLPTPTSSSQATTVLLGDWAEEEVDSDTGSDSSETNSDRS